MLKIENFRCGYGAKPVIENFSANFEKGEITAISAISGKGKTTLLKAINRLHEEEDNGFFKEGKIEVLEGNSYRNIDEMDVVKLRRDIGYIFQSPLPLPLSIEKNVEFGLRLLGSIDKERVHSALKRVGLWNEVKERLQQSAFSLSLGQQQRLAIARVLVLKPKIILFDEPTSSLDEKATLKIEELMRELKKDRVIILVTHDNKQIDRVCDKEIEI